MAAKKATATKSTAAKKSAPTKKTAAKKTAAKKTPTKKTPTKKTPTKKTPTKKTPTKKTPTKKTATKKTATTTSAAKNTTTKETTAKKTPAKRAPAKKATVTQKAARLAVREDESPWSAKELKEVRAELDIEIQRLRDEITTAETGLSEFLKEPIAAAGDDQADAGAKSFEREHELSLVEGARTGLEQNLHALERLEDGTYGICESCGKPIGKLRLQAYPRATLCLSCKSKQERR